MFKKFLDILSFATVVIWGGLSLFLIWFAREAYSQGNPGFALGLLAAALFGCFQLLKALSEARTQFSDSEFRMETKTDDLPPIATELTAESYALIDRVFQAFELASIKLPPDIKRVVSERVLENGKAEIEVSDILHGFYDLRYENFETANSNDKLGFDQTCADIAKRFPHTKTKKRYYAEGNSIYIFFWLTGDEITALNNALSGEGAKFKVDP